MKLYQKIKNQIESDYIKSGKLKPGDRLPTYAFFQEQYKVSLETIMLGVNELEKQGIVIRKSPRRFHITERRNILAANGVGMMGFSGNVFGDYEDSLKRRLYDRNIFCYSVNPPMNPKDVDRYYERFFQNEYHSLILRDYSVPCPERLEKYRDRFGQLILVFEPSSRQWKMPHHGIFINVESAIYEALKVLYLNGYRRVALFTPGPAENIIDTSKKARGYIRFMEEFKIAERAEDFSVKVYNSYELSRKKQLVVKWAKELHPETDAIIGFSDYNIIKAQEWLQDYSKIDFRKICFIGRGNTNWSSSGPNRFASFDFRIEDIITETLELINSSPTEPVIRILKPKLKRKELIKSRN